MVRSSLMKKIVFFLLITVLAGSPLELAVADLTPASESEAYERFKRRKSKTELSKLLYLMDRFKVADFKVRYAGSWYDATWAMKQARSYLKRYYDGEDSSEFVHKHAYRPRFGDGIVYLKLADGEVRLLRDALLEELEILNQLEA